MIFKIYFLVDATFIQSTYFRKKKKEKKIWQKY